MLKEILPSSILNEPSIGQRVIAELTAKAIGVPICMHCLYDPSNNILSCKANYNTSTPLQPLQNVTWIQAQVLSSPISALI